MRQIACFLAGSFLGIAILLLLISVQEGVPTSSSKWASDLYKIKESHAQNASGVKLLIVAGSNSLFGLYAPELEQKFGLHTTNFGVHAGLGLKYILDRSKRSLHSGDIVYLPLEYALYQQSVRPSAQLMDFALARDPHYLHSLPLSHQFLGFTNVSFNRIVEGLLGGSDEYLGSSSKIYNGNNVDISGNQTKNTLEDSFVYNGKLRNIKAKSIADGEITQYSREVLFDYFEWAKKHGVCVIGAPPNLLDSNEYHSEKFLLFFKKIKKMYSEKNIVFVGNPEDYLLPENLFFDTEYHLNQIGVTTRTKMTINDLGSDLRAHCARK